MASIGSLTADLRLQSAAFLRDLTKASRAVESNTAAMRKSMREVERASKDVSKQFAGFSKQLNVVKAAVAAAGFGLLIRDVIRTSAEFQRLQSSLKTVTGSAQAASAAFAQIKDFAATTPYSLQEVTGAFIKLKALGLDPSRKALESYGNTASAMGKSLNDFIEAVADAATGEFERLKEFGIRASSEGSKVTFTFQNVATTVGKSAQEIEAYLRNIGEVQFAGAMEEQAKTLGGALSNLGDAFAVFQNEIGEGGLAAAVADIAREMAEATNNSQNLAREVGAVLGDGIRAAAEAARFLVGHMRELAAAVGAVVAYKAATVFAGIAVAVGRYVLAVRAAAAATAGFTAALAANPIGLVAVAISTAVAALILFYDKTIEIGGKTVEVGKVIYATWISVKETVLSAVNTLVSAAQAASAVLIGDFARAGEIVKQAFAESEASAQRILDAWADIGPAVAGGSAEAADAVSDLKIALDKAVAAATDTEKAIAKSTKALMIEAQQNADLANALRRSKEEYEALKEAIELENEAARLNIDFTTEQGRAWRDAYEDARKYRKELTELEKKQKDAADAARRLQEEQERAARKWKEWLEQRWAAAFDNAINGVQGAMADAFEEFPAAVLEDPATADLINHKLSEVF